MEIVENKEQCWSTCSECHGRGKKSRGLSKKVKHDYLIALEKFEKSDRQGVAPSQPKGHLYSCLNCGGSGLIPSADFPIADKEKFPHVAIIGGGIGGVALAVACLHRGIPFTLYERDLSFDTRSQGYGLTLQQAGKAIEGLGIFSLEEKVISTKHIVHTTDGKIIGEWGVRKWTPYNVKANPKRSNMHISRQALRLKLLGQLGEENFVKWGYQLIDFKKCDDESYEINFEVEGELKKIKADLIVGADGIRSRVRKLLIGEERFPLRYLDCMVILGICSLSALKELDSPLLDSATVFQTANGTDRIYVMPYSSDSVMWQLSFPISESAAKLLSAQGPHALKEESCLRTHWHDPIPQIVSATLESQISGYPVYDRELLPSDLLGKVGSITLIGDAAHPMSPFKGQGANQALIDSLSLAREIAKACNASKEWRKTDIRKGILNAFEEEMLERTAIKVKGSALAAEFLHSEIVLDTGDAPRGRLTRKNRA